MSKDINKIIDYLKITHTGYDEMHNKWYIVTGYTHDKKFVERRAISHNDYQLSDASARLKKLQFTNLIGTNDKERRKISEEIINNAKTKKFKVVTRNGWNQLGLFVLGDQLIGATDDHNHIEMQLPNAAGLVKGAIAQHGDYKAWREGILNSIKGQKLAMFAVMCAFSPPLSPFSRLTNTFGFQLVGGSRSGKTTLGVVAGSVWGGGDPNRGAISSWNHTVNNFERIAAYHNNLLLVLDETKASDNRSRDGWTANLMRITEENSKGRATEDNQVRWQLRFLSTSEFTLSELMQTASNTNDGEHNRMFDILCEEQVINGQGSAFSGVALTHTADLALKLHRCAIENYGHAGKAFLEQLTEDMKANGADTIKDMVQSYEAKFAKRAMKNKRAQHASDYQVKCFATVYAAGKVAQRFNILDWSDKEIYQSCIFALKQFLKAPSYPALRLKRVLEKYVAEQVKSRNVTVWNDKLPTSLRKADMSLAWHDKKNAYVFTTTLFASLAGCSVRKLGTFVLEMNRQGLSISHDHIRAGTFAYFITVRGLNVNPQSNQGGANATIVKKRLKTNKNK